MSSRIAELRSANRLDQLRERGRKSRRANSVANANGTAKYKLRNLSQIDSRDHFGSFGLTGKQYAFVLEYIADPGSQTDAAIRAGYSERSAHSAASALLRNDNVKAAIDHMQEILRENTGITAEAVLNRLGEIALTLDPNREVLIR